MPLSGQGSVGDELKSVTLSPCRATSKDEGTCTTEVNECKYGIGKVKIVRDGKNLIVTPFCFVPAPADSAPSSDSGLGSPAGEPRAPGTDERVPHSDPGEL
jgi:hypothetical protein